MPEAAAADGNILAPSDTASLPPPPASFNCCCNIARFPTGDGSGWVTLPPAALSSPATILFIGTLPTVPLVTSPITGGWAATCGTDTCTGRFWAGIAGDGLRPGKFVGSSSFTVAGTLVVTGGAAADPASEAVRENAGPETTDAAVGPPASGRGEGLVGNGVVAGEGMDTGPVFEGGVRGSTSELLS